jgi:ADP-heptose:LPS heptosyltransferase
VRLPNLIPFFIYYIYLFDAMGFCQQLERASGDDGMMAQIIPNSLEYINTDDFRLFKWKNAIEEKIGTRKPKIGIVYNGLLSSFIEKHIPLEEFKILCELNVDLICIHRKKDIQADIDKYEKMHINKDAENKIHFFEIDEDEPFSDTVGILKNLDLLITIDTYIVHLAGILNVKTWLLLGYSEWRWSNDPHKTYWYKNKRRSYCKY